MAELTVSPELTVSQEQLDAWAHACGRAISALLPVQEALARAGNAEMAQQLQPAAEATGTLLQWLIRAGAARMSDAPAPAEPPLPPLNTPAARRLLALLHEAEDVAGEVDQERGWTCGGWAEAIENLAFPLSAEVHGPPGQFEKG